ncbi:MAG: twin-arginine translocase subunit TatC [Bacteroidales bacterium]|nr:twin-arginine translocase subunit TatC [Bacteroidales bacterium]
MTDVSDNTQDNNKVQEEMSFWQHLEELRWHITRSIIAVIVFAVVAFLNRKIIFDEIILAPRDSEFITNRVLCKLADILSFKSLCFESFNLTIINIKMSGQFLTHMYISIIAGIIITIPYIIWEIWSFIKPALYKNERKYTNYAVISSSLLFIIGILFSYFLIVPLTVNFLGTYHVSEFVQNQVSLKSYVNTVVSVTFAVGIVFELPIFMYFFTKVGLVTPSFLKKNRKYMLVICLILSAIITPPDVFSQILVCIPLIALYEISILISKRVYRKRQQELAG